MAKIKADPDLMVQIAQDLQRGVDNLAEVFSRARRDVTKLSGEFEGNAARDFFSKWETEQKQFEQSVIALQQHSTKLNGAAAEFARADTPKGG